MAKYLFFIGYRRVETGGEAARIRYQLSKRFAAARIFKDSHLLTAGPGGATREALAETRIYLALIGPNWSLLLEEDKRDRIKNHMTFELEIALASPSVTVVPVLIGGAAMPVPSMLPSEIAALAALAPCVLRADPAFRDDLDALVDALDLHDQEVSPAIEPPSPASGARIFVSHSTRDGVEPATAIAKGLEARGVPCWIAPRDVMPGTLYPGQIVRAVEACRGFVLVLTPDANESPDVLQEVQIAHSSRKLIAPIIVGDVLPNADIRYFITVRHHIAWSTGDAVAGHLLQTFGKR
jgi:hypothetical protein